MRPCWRFVKQLAIRCACVFMKLDSGGRNCTVSNSHSFGFSQTNVTGTYMLIGVLCCAPRAKLALNTLNVSETKAVQKYAAREFPCKFGVCRVAQTQVSCRAMMTARKRVFRSS
jgi:hypothetical protein